MLALVMSGAASRGPMELGAAEVLFARGFHPQMMIGTSAGGINAVYLAIDPTAEGARRAVELWAGIGRREVGTKDMFAKGLVRLLTKRDGFLPEDPIVAYLQRCLPTELETFGQLRAINGIQVFTTGVCLETNTLRVFGDRDDDQIIDGLMATGALPPYIPPRHVDGYRYIDGGALTKLPLIAAVERGATEIVALRVSHPPRLKIRKLFDLVYLSVGITTESQVDLEIKFVEKTTNVPVWVIDLPGPEEISSWDFTHAEELAELGRKIAQRDLRCWTPVFPN